MKRMLALCGAALVAIAVVVASGSALTQAQPANRQVVAEHILKTQQARFLTWPAQIALQLTMRNDRQLAPRALKLGAATERRGGHDSPPGHLANVRVNDPALDGNQIDQTTQSETSIAVVGRNVAVGYNDSQRTPLFFEAGSSLSGYSYSTNGGSSFTDGGAVSNAPEFNNLGDPWLASDRSGAMYYANLALDGFNGNLDVGVAKSTDGGKTWTAPVPVYRPTSDIFYLADKDAMAVGPSPAHPAHDNLYVAYSDSVADPATGDFSNGLPVARSTDGGVTWQLSYADKRALDPTTCSFEQYIGAIPTVDSHGNLYVAAEKITVDDPNCTFTALPTFSEWVFKSTDGGQTFDPGVKVADVTPSFPNGLLSLGPGKYMRNLELPTIALLGNNVYIAWNDGESGHSHIRVAKSVDGGATWTLSWATQGSNDELQPALSGDQSSNGELQPALAGDRSRGLHLLYYQRNPGNTLDVIVGNSSNGSSFSPQRVTTESFPGVFTVPPFDPIIASAYMGDYISNVSAGARQYFAWGDNRDTVKNFMWPQGRNDPNVYFAKR